MIKDIAEGFGREEDLLFRHEINLRAGMNCLVNLIIFSAISLLW
jgi:hypothetical protein